ncbi:putative holin-like toxin [Vagococcus fluvialis]|uniref:putative holin-like toxin n=1 Tax=Vagococcus fluvialis TaxID=2738 RepID=UPI003B58F842
MKISIKSRKGEALLSALETIQLLLGFGTFVIALIKLVVDLVKNDKKNNRHLNFGEFNGYF